MIDLSNPNKFNEFANVNLKNETNKDVAPHTFAQKLIYQQQALENYQLSIRHTYSRGNVSNLNRFPIILGRAGRIDDEDNSSNFTLFNQNSIVEGLKSSNSTLSNLGLCDLICNHISIENLMENLIDDEDNSSNFIRFNQNTIIDGLKSSNSTLSNFVSRFGGLCDLICNHILIENLLDEKSPKIFRECITLEKIDQPSIKKSHLLDIYSIFRKAIAFLFLIYPDNILSIRNQWRLVQKDLSDKDVKCVNRKILEEGLSTVKIGTALKLEVFKKEGFKLTGHSLLIKKTNKDEYTFFDPNIGKYSKLSFMELSDHIDEQLKMWQATDILLMKAESFLARL